MSHPTSNVLTVEEIAQFLRVSRATVCRWCQNGRLPAFRIGRAWRIHREDFERYSRSMIKATPNGSASAE